MDKLRIASANTERPATKAQAHDACCAHDAPAHGPTTDGKGQAHDHSATPVQAAPIGKGWTRYRVATMDCAAEESEIRRAVDGIAGIRALSFQLGQRTLAMDAPVAAVELAIVAIRKAGFDPQPLTDANQGSTHAGTEGEHGFESEGLWRLGLALLMAICAELVGYFAPDTQVWKGVGLAVAAAAIWMAGFDVYKKG
jgi:Zn2+/Cd2+-exporting ATPase